MNAKKITLLGIMLSMMLILGLVEKQFVLVPGVPGIKPGFSNIVLMFALYRMDTRSAGTLLVLKVLLSGLLFAGVNGMAYAFCGGILAFGIMFLLIRSRRLGLPVVSVSGAVMHMVGQLLCSRFLMGSWVLAFQLPLLLVSAVVTGVLNGVITALVINALTQSKLSFLPGKADKEVNTNVKKKIPAYVVLLAITLIAGIVLGGTYTLTKDPIAVESARKMEEARKNALPEADTFRLVRGVTDEGLFGSATAQGKVGPVYVEVIMQNDGTITSMNIGDENYAETPEYAADVLEDAFKSQFIGKKAPFAIASSDPSANAADGVIGSAQGFAGAVEVKVSFDESNKITSFAIVEENFNETPDYGGKALHPDFTGQFVGKQAPMELSDIDAVSRATITSTAVVNAVNKAYNIANATPIDAVTGATVTSEAVVEAINSAAAADTGMDWCYEGLKDGEVAGYVAQTTVKGFGGKVEVITGVNRDQKITGISVGGSGFSETPGLGAKAKEDKFTSQFIGKNAAESIGVIKAGNPKGDNDVDAITAATITSSAVAGGVNSIASYSSSLISALPEPPVEMIKPEVTYASSSMGYGGPVDAEVGFDEDGYIVYLAVGQSERFAETDTIGGKCRDISFTGQFIGLSGDVTVDEIDVISGATVTSEAVVSAVNKSYKKFLDATAPAEQTPAPDAPAADVAPAATSEFSGSAKGYNGPVQITATFDADGKIATLVIGGDKFAESQGIGDKALDPAFAAQFIGKQAPLTLANIDAITGATVTSEAVVNAVNKAYDKFLAAAPVSAPAASAPAQDVPVTGNVFSASSKGYNGPVQVTVTFDAEGKITSLSIGGDKFSESQGIGDKALEPAFAEQFIGKQAPVALADIDAITGATVTSEAVVNAVKKAYDKFLEAAPVSAPAASAPAQDVPVTGNVFSASSKGYNGPVQVTVTFDAEGKITSLSIGGDKFSESQGIGDKALEPAFAEQFIGKQAPVAVEDIDVITGATVTSEAVVSAVNKAHNKFLGQ